MSVNYLPDMNKFSLAGPPKWWLHRLWDFDASLVVVPSRERCVYRLGQRRKLNLPENIVNDALFNHSDTKMLARYSLVPVTYILPTANWSDPLMFIELANRAPWRQGGTEKVVQKLDEQEAKEELLKREATDSVLTETAKDAWNLYQKKIGIRSHMYIPRTKGSVVSSKSPAIRVK